MKFIGFTLGLIGFGISAILFTLHPSLAYAGFAAMGLVAAGTEYAAMIWSKEKIDYQLVKEEEALKGGTPVDHTDNT